MLSYNSQGTKREGGESVGEKMGKEQGENGKRKKTT